MTADDLDIDDIQRTLLCNADIPCGRLTMGDVWHDIKALALVAEVRRLRDENAALERKLNAALVDVVNMANEETAAAEAHEEALDRLRDENAQLDAICRWNREHVATVVDEEFGLRVGGMACEHPCLTGDRCDACGWTQAWEADRG